MMQIGQLVRATRARATGDHTDTDPPPFKVQGVRGEGGFEEIFDGTRWCWAKHFEPVGAALLGRTQPEPAPDDLMAVMLPRAAVEIGAHLWSTYSEEDQDAHDYAEDSFVEACRAALSRVEPQPERPQPDADQVEACSRAYWEALEQPYAGSWDALAPKTADNVRAGIAAVLARIAPDVAASVPQGGDGSGSPSSPDPSPSVAAVQPDPPERPQRPHRLADIETLVEQAAGTGHEDADFWASSYAEDVGYLLALMTGEPAAPTVAPTVSGEPEDPPGVVERMQCSCPAAGCIVHAAMAADQNRMRYDGTLDSYWSVLAWMKDAGDTHALANEVQYRTPIVLFPSANGWQAARPGDWIEQDEHGRFVAVPPVAAPESEPAPPNELSVGDRFTVKAEYAESGPDVTANVAYEVIETESIFGEPAVWFIDDAGYRHCLLTFKIERAAPAPSPDRPGLSAERRAELDEAADMVHDEIVTAHLSECLTDALAEIDRLTAAASPDPERPSREQYPEAFAIADGVIALFDPGASGAPSPDPEPGA